MRERERIDESSDESLINERLVLGAAGLMASRIAETRTVVTRGGYHCHIGDTWTIVRGMVNYSVCFEPFGLSNEHVCSEFLDF